jgi:hypothetical protein
MPAYTPCAHCATVGFVRREYVIARGRAAVQYYCGRCDRTWNILEEHERRARPRPVIHTATEEPDRSRNPQPGRSRAIPLR